MKTLRFALFAAALSAAAQPVPTIPGDAQRGAEVFESQKCVTCHSVQGRGGRTAPDLGTRSARAYTPTEMAALMWNHGPVMWPAMEKAGIGIPPLTEQQAADLYAYFYAFRYFEKPADAGRGRRVFERRGSCTTCHGMREGGSEGAPPVASWRSLQDSIALASDMWNHATPMRAALSRRNMTWPVLNAQEMADLVLYLRTTLKVDSAAERYAPADATTGATLFKVKGCAECHEGSLALERRARFRTTAEFAAAMWNHAPKMVQLPPNLSPEEMRRLVGFLWSIQYFETPGNPARGEKLFTSKNCASCHNDPSSGTPSLAGRRLNSIRMASALWQHGPQMHERMKQRNLKWPQFRHLEMSDLIAYLGSLK
jgi:cytochrome c2